LENARTISNDWVVRYHNRSVATGGRRAATVRPRQNQVLVAKGGTGTSPSSYRGARCGGRRYRRSQPIEMERKPASHRSRRGARKWVPPSSHPVAAAAQESSNEKGSCSDGGAAVVGLAFRFA